MSRARLVVSFLSCWPFLWSALTAAAASRPSQADLGEAWDLYRQGSAREADRRLRVILEARPQDAEARRLQVLTAYVIGDYERALGEYERLPEKAGARGELRPLMVQAFEHLNRPDQALALARQGGFPKAVLAFMEERARRPLSVALAQTTVVPFASDNPLGDLMPAVPVVINGQARVAHLDTGGAYIALAPSTAAGLGISLSAQGEGRANAQKSSVAAGLAESLTIGDAALRNVPVHGLSALEGEKLDPRLKSMIVIGTNVLEQFLTTWDNDKKRLILSPRRDEQARPAHFALIPKPASEIDFLLQGDHFLLAQGGAGTHTGLVFFVDTGLVLLDDKGRQLGLAVTAETAKKWGLDLAAPAKRFADAPEPVALGPWRQTGIGVTLLEFGGATVWQGVEVSALLPHGFMRRYVWTLDFDRHKWLMSEVQAGPAQLPADIGGRYEVAPGTAFEVVVENGSVFLLPPGQKRVPLQANGDGAFMIPGAGAKVTFVKDAAGAVTQLVLEQAGRKTEAKRVR